MPQTILILTNRIPYPLHDGGALAMNAMIRGYKPGWQVYLLAMNTTRHLVPPDKLKELYTDLAGFETVLINNEVSTQGIAKNLLFSSEPEHADRFPLSIRQYIRCRTLSSSTIVKEELNCRPDSKIFKSR